MEGASESRCSSSCSACCFLLLPLDSSIYAGMNTKRENIMNRAWYRCAASFIEATSPSPTELGRPGLDTTLNDSDSIIHLLKIMEPFKRM